MCYFMLLFLWNVAWFIRRVVVYANVPFKVPFKVIQWYEICATVLTVIQLTVWLVTGCVTLSPIKSPAMFIKQFNYDCNIFHRSAINETMRKTESETKGISYGCLLVFGAPIINYWNISKILFGCRYHSVILRNPTCSWYQWKTWKFKRNAEWNCHWNNA